MNYKPYAISWNTTYRCNLRCSHCYLDTNALTRQSANELSTNEGFRLIDQMAELNPNLLLILTGGEPLLREDIYEIAYYAFRKGMMVVLGTNGNLIDDGIARRLKESGVTGIGISLDSVVPERHDEFRGISGAWDDTIKGIEACCRQGLEFQIQTTVTRENFNEIPNIIEFCYNLGAKVFNLFFLVCTGKGQELTDIIPQQYDQALHQLYETQKKYQGKMLVGAKCAPHYRRIVYEHDTASPLIRAYSGGCPAGTHYCRITPEGNVTPCPYMPNIVGNVRKKSFVELWMDTADFQTLRGDNLNGRCGTCEFRYICKGCRARALATSGNQMDEDSWCDYVPGKYGNKAILLKTSETFGTEEEFTMHWNIQAKNILKQIPSFSRGMTIKNVEQFAINNNYREITPEIMKIAREKMVENKRTAFPNNEIDNTEEQHAKSESCPNQNDEIPWTEEALKRVENAPDFVMPGIYKLMQKKARLHGYKEITSKFLSEIRDESMMLASKRIKNIGFDELRMEAWDKAKEKLKNVHKKNVIEKIKTFLGERTIRNEGIIAKFQSYLKTDAAAQEENSVLPVWAEDARQRLENAPIFVRSRAKKSIEDFASQRGVAEITCELIDQYMKNIPSFVKNKTK